MDRENDKAKVSLRDYYRAVRLKGRDLFRETGWLSLAVGKVMPVLIAIIIIGLIVFGDAAHSSFATYLDGHRLPLALSAMTLLVVGLYQWIKCWFLAPYELHNDAIAKKVETRDEHEKNVVQYDTRIAVIEEKNETEKAELKRENEDLRRKLLELDLATTRLAGIVSELKKYADSAESRSFDKQWAHDWANGVATYLSKTLIHSKASRFQRDLYNDLQYSIAIASLRALADSLGVSDLNRK